MLEVGRKDLERRLLQLTASLEPIELKLTMQNGREMTVIYRDEVYILSFAINRYIFADDVESLAEMILMLGKSYTQDIVN
jgi:hypothetical protein